MRRIAGAALFALVGVLCAGAQQAPSASQSNGLVTAARNGNRAVMRSLLADGVRIDCQGARDGETALTAAIEEDELGSVRFLLEQGARVDAPNRAGVVPLQMAIDHSNQAAILLLVAKGLEVEAPSSSGASWLHYAAAHHHAGAVAVLLLMGAHPESTDAAGRTPLLAAVCTKPVDAVAGEDKLGVVLNLLSWNARLDAKAAHGDTVQSCEARNQPLNVAAVLNDAVLERAALAKAEEKAKLAKAGDGAADLRFNLLLKAFDRNQDDEYVRGLIFAAAQALPKPRAVPAEAVRVHDAAMIALKSADEHDTIERPIAELRRVVEMAPWWREAYRDLALALEKNGQYEWATEQMAHYLRSRPQGAVPQQDLEQMIRIELEADMVRRSLK